MNDIFRLLMRLQNNACEEEQVKTLVFCARKITCEKVSRMLRHSGIPCQFIHGDCSQARRDDAMRSTLYICAVQYNR